MLSGGTLAIYFPVTASRLFPFEVELYYIQHILILVVPVFLLSSHGSYDTTREQRNTILSISVAGGYSLEPVGSFRWTILSIASFRLYHYLVLQPVSLVRRACLARDRC